MNTPPKVSVIIPVYNVAKYLPQCLESVSRQTLGDIDIIAVDDGSTDGSGKILDDWAQREPRLRVIHQANAGAGAARNAGMSLATGEYLFFVDPDDFCRRGMLKAMYLRGVRCRADIVIACRSVYDDERRAVVAYRGLPPRLWLKKQPIAAREIADDIFMFSKNVAWDKLFRREFLVANKLEFQCIPRSNDVLFVNAALALADRMALAFGAWICHRKGREGSLQSTKDKSPECIYRAFDALREKLEERGLFSVFGRSYVEGLLTSGLYNLRTLRMRENVDRSYRELKGRLSALCEGRRLSDCVPDARTERRLKQLLDSQTPDDFVRKAEKGDLMERRRPVVIPFAVRESLKIALHIVRKACFRR